MRAFVRAVAVGAAVIGTLAFTAAPAMASTAITEPSGDVIAVSLDGEGYAAPFTVTARGFEPYENVFIEQCNGRPPSAEHWTPTIDCDLGSAPAAAVAGTDGVVTFAATDPNHVLRPFVGAGPQALFNCLPKRGSVPDNGMEDFRNCQIRISTSNTAGTSDQVFLTLALPEGAKLGMQPLPGRAASGAADASVAGNQNGSGQSAPSSARAEGSATTSSTSSGSSTSSFPYAAVVLPLAAVAIGGASFFIHRRRSGRVAA